VGREYDVATWATDYDFPALTSGTVTKDSISHRRPERVNAVIFNLRRPLFTDLRVRRALSMMLDFEWINRAILFGQGKRIRSFFPNTDLAHTPEDPLPDTITRDVQAKAAALLADAGWVVKGGQRVNRDTGAPLRFEILLAAPDDEKIALVYANALKKLGVTASLRTLDTSAYRNRLNDYDFDATISFWNTSLSPGSEQLLYWSCEAARQPARLNYAGVCDPDIDALAKDVADTPSRVDLVKTVKDLDARLYALHFAIPLHYIGADLFAYATTLKRPAQTPLYGTMLENWWHEPAPSGGMDSPPVR